jgi:hypothetical protein
MINTIRDENTNQYPRGVAKWAHRSMSDPSRHATQRRCGTYSSRSLDCWRRESGDHHGFDGQDSRDAFPRRKADQRSGMILPAITRYGETGDNNACVERVAVSDARSSRSSTSRCRAVMPTQTRNGSGPSATQVCYDDPGEDDGKPSNMKHTQGFSIDDAPAKSYPWSEVGNGRAKQRAATVNELVIPKQDKYGTKAHRYEEGNTGYYRRSCDFGRKARPCGQKGRG